MSMIRRTGRSQACLTCLRRKKGCDVQKPACGQCRQAAIHCEGYSRPLVFKNAGLSLPRKHSGASTSETDDIVLPETLTRSAYQNRLFELFWRLYLPRGRSLSHEVAVNSVGGWIEAVQASQNHGKVVTKSLLALSLALVGRMDQVPWMSAEGQRLYGSALYDMGKSLSQQHKPKGKESMQALVAVRCLSLFEATQVKDVKNNKNKQAQSRSVHNLGEKALIQNNSPTFYATGRAHRLFADGRLNNLTIQALNERKGIFLTEPRWKTIPWTHHAKTPKDHLVDILVDLPTVFQRVDSFFATRVAQRKNRQELITACHDLETRLATWHEVYHTRYSSTTLDPTCSTYTSADAITAAHILTLYWITRILILTELRDLLNLRMTPIFPSQESLRAHFLSDLDCISLVRTLPTLLHRTTGMFRIHLATFPLAVAQRHFHAPGSEGRLCRERELVEGFLALPECATMRQFLWSLKPERTLGGWGK